MSDRFRVIVGWVIFAVAATAPAQIVYTQRTNAEPPPLLAWFVAAAPVLATIAAATAAYWTARQAQEAGRQADELVRSRRAERLTPLRVDATDVLNDARHYTEYAAIYTESAPGEDIEVLRTSTTTNTSTISLRTGHVSRIGSIFSSDSPGS